MKRAYTNKKTGQIDDGLVRDVVDLVQTQVYDEVSQLQTDDDDSTASTNLSRVRINEIVESVSFFFLKFNLIISWFLFYHQFILSKFGYLYFSRFQRKRDVWSVWVVAPGRLLLLLHHMRMLIQKFLRLSWRTRMIGYLRWRPRWQLNRRAMRPRRGWTSRWWRWWRGCTRTRCSRTFKTRSFFFLPKTRNVLFNFEYYLLCFILCFIQF